jgi:hypothetical protein
MQAINLAIDMQGDFDYSLQKLIKACEIVATQIPRTEKDSGVDGNKSTATLEVDEAMRRQARIERKHKRLGRAMRQFWKDLVAERCSQSEVVEGLNEEYNRTQEWAAEQDFEYESEEISESDEYHTPTLHYEVKDMMLVNSDSLPDKSFNSRQNDEYRKNVSVAESGSFTARPLAAEDFLKQDLAEGWRPSGKALQPTTAAGRDKKQWK